MENKDQAPAAPSVAVLITNYNTWALTELCVQSCYRHDEGRFEKILVYDDCSATESAGSFPESTRIVRGAVNVGLVKALNIAFRLISEDIVVLFDCDAYPTTPFCDEVREMFARDPSLGLVGFQTIGSDGGRRESYTTEPNVWSVVLGNSLYAKAEQWCKDKSGRLSIFTCAMAVRRSAFEEMSGFDEEFDWLDLDHDFSMRMNRSRWKLAIAPRAVVFHEGGGTPQLTRHRVLRFYKARWLLLRKFNRVPMRPLVKALVLARLSAEYLILLALGPVLFRKKAVREDKVQGRRDLIQFCLKNF